MSDPSRNIDNFCSSVAFGANKYFKGALVGVDTLLEYCDAYEPNLRRQLPECSACVFSNPVCQS